MFDLKTLKDLVEMIADFSTFTVKELRARARKVRDDNGLKKRFKGMWSLRKKELVSLLAEVELSLMNINPPEIERMDSMLFKQIEGEVAASVVKGAARGAKALGAESVEEFHEKIQAIHSDVEANVDVFNVSALESAETKSKLPAPDKKTAAKKSGK